MMHRISSKKNMAFDSLFSYYVLKNKKFARHQYLRVSGELHSAKIGKV